MLPLDVEIYMGAGVAGGCRARCGWEGGVCQVDGDTFEFSASSNLHDSTMVTGRGRVESPMTHPVPPLLLPDAHKACAQAQQEAQTHQHTDGHIDARVHMVPSRRPPAKVWGRAAFSWGWRQRGWVGC